MPKLTDREIDELLSPVPGARTGTPTGEMKLATIRHTTGAPAVNTVGFVYRERELLITARQRAAWLDDIRHDPRVCCIVDSDVYPLPKVTISGAAVIRHEPGEDDLWRDVRNPTPTPGYVPQRLPDGREAWAWVEAYSKLTWNEPRALVVVALATAKVTSWRMPIEGEALDGVWASSYFDAADRPSFTVDVVNAGRGDVRVVRDVRPRV